MRSTSDLDVSMRARGEEFEQAFRARLAEGWGTVSPSKGELRRNPDAPDRLAFTAALRAAKIHDPGLARPEYVMHPYRVSIAFLGGHWGALDVEVSDPEIDAHAHTRKEIDGDLLQLLWNATPDLSILHRLCMRTFDWRRQQSWPSLPVRPMEDWALAYTDAREETEIGGETPVLPDIAAARDWLARVIEAIPDTDT